MSLQKKQWDPAQPLRILVVKNRAMGDSIIGLSSLSYIKTIFSNAKITYGLPSWILPLYSRVETPADNYLNVDLKGFKDYIRLFHDIRSGAFDLIIELHQSGRTGRFLSLLSRFFSIPYYFHNHHDLRGTFIKDQGKRRAAIQKDLDACWSICQALLFAGCPTGLNLPPPHYLQFPPQIKLPPVPDSERQSEKATVVLGLVATRKTKFWPIEHFRRLIEIIHGHFPQVEFIVPLSSSALDREIEEQMQSHHFPTSVQIVKRPLDQLPGILSKASLYIGNDTGIKHLCVGLQIPTLSFFGPEEPLEWHPYSSVDHPYFFIEGLECRTRISHFCALNECESMICLKQITPEQVFRLIQEKGLLNRSTQN